MGTMGVSAYAKKKPSTAAPTKSMLTASVVLLSASEVVYWAFESSIIGAIFLSTCAEAKSMQQVTNTTKNQSKDSLAQTIL